MRTLTLIFLVLILSACTPASPRVGPDRLLYTSGDGYVYIVNYDGTDQVRLVQGRVPTWSPKGDQIAFLSSPQEGSNIFLTQVDKGGSVRLTQDDVASMAWSPNGEQIAFNTGANLYLINSAAGLFNTPKRLAHGYNLRNETWSPDGRSIAYAYQDSEDAAEEIVVQDLNGGNINYLTLGQAEAHQWCAPQCSADFAPSWSPDGKQIAFVSDRSGNLEIYAIRVDGTNLRQLTNTHVQAATPAWSPDGSQLLFIVGPDSGAQIYVMNANGANQRPLTNPGTVSGCAAWSPDGHKIIFSSNRDGHYQIYIMDADGSHQIQLISDARDDFCPQWQPQPNP